MKSKAKSKKSSLISCYVIAYDIADDKRRTKIHKVLLGFGKWTQYSLFECFLSGKDLILLRSKLAEHLVAKEDSVRFYRLCADCVSKVETVGGPPPADEVLFLVEAGQVSARRSDAVAERRIAPGSGSCVIHKKALPGRRCWTEKPFQQ